MARAFEPLIGAKPDRIATPDPNDTLDVAGLDRLFVTLLPDADEQPS